MSAPLCVGSTLDTIWLGKPGSMVALPRPDGNLNAPITRGAVGHGLISGGTTVTRRRRSRFTYALSWTQTDADTADAIIDFYAGRQGSGPFALIDPSWRNLLSYAVSTMGGAERANTAWRALATGSVIPTVPLIDPTVAPPTGARSDVLRWHAPTLGSVLWPGAVDGAGSLLTDVTNMVPWLPASGGKVSIWVKADGTPAVGSQIGLYLAGLSGDHFTGATYSIASVPLTSSWQRIVVDGSTLTWTNAVQYVAPLVQSVTLAPGVDVLVAAPQIEYSRTVGPYVQGLGCPRVVILDPLGNSGTVWWRRSHTLTLPEV